MIRYPESPLTSKRKGDSRSQFLRQRYSSSADSSDFSLCLWKLEILMKMTHICRSEREIRSGLILKINGKTWKDHLYCIIKTFWCRKSSLILGQNEKDARVSLTTSALIFSWKRVHLFLLYRVFFAKISYSLWDSFTPTGLNLTSLSFFHLIWKKR